MISRFMLAFFFLSGCATSNGPNYVQNGNQYARDNLLREAVASFHKALATDPDDAAAHRSLGIVLVRLGNYTKALDHLSRALPRYPDDFELNFFLGETNRSLDRQAKAIYHYQKCLTLRPNDPATLRSLTWTYFKIRFYSEALATGEKLLAIKPGDVQASIILARIQIKLGQSKKALALLQSIKSKADRETRPYILTIEGDAHLQNDQFNKAQGLYSEALKSNPLLAGALYGSGRCLLNRGEVDESIVYLERAIHVTPNLSEAYYYLGAAYEGKNPAKSLHYYKTFRKRALTDPAFLSVMGAVKKKIAQLTTIGAQSDSDSQPPR